MVELDGQKFQFEGANPPSEQEARAAVTDMSSSQSQPEQQATQYSQGEQDQINAINKMGGSDKSISQPKDTLNFGDHAKLSFLDPQGQVDYIKNKYRYAEPDGNGNILYGNDPNNLQPVNQEGIFNDFVAKLGNLTSLLPSIAGQIALTAGTEGMALPAIFGRAALGSGSGQLLSNLAGIKMGNKVDPEKIAVDTALSAGFGVAGEAAGMALAGGTKAIMKKAGSVLDDYRNGVLLSGKDVNSFDNGTATALHITTGLDKNTIKTGQILGWDKIFSSPEATNVNGIADIAGDVAKGISTKSTELGKAVDTATKGLIDSTKGNVVDTAPVLQTLFKDLHDMGIVDITKSAANPLGTAILNKNSPLNKKFFSDFMHSLGASEADMGGGYKGFMIDEASSKISVADTLRIKRGFQAAVNDGNLSSAEANIAKRALYGNLEEGISGLSDQLAKISDRVGYKPYQLANGAFSDFMKTTKALKQAGMDVDNPIAIQNYLTHINNASPLAMPILQKLDGSLGNNFLQRAQAWGVNTRISNISPNLLRLGMVSSLFGAGLLDPSIGGKFGKTATAVALGTPIGLKLILRGAGGGTQSVLKSTLGVTAKINKVASSKGGRAVLGQLMKNKITGQ